jgi:protein translocase SecG subunit
LEITDVWIFGFCGRDCCVADDRAGSAAKSEGGGLGIGSGTAGGLMTARGGATLLTRATAVLAGVFMVLCLVLVLMQQKQKAKSPWSICCNKRGNLLVVRRRARRRVCGSGSSCSQ